MTVLASSIVTRARSALIDAGDNGAPLRWSDADLMRYISDGQRTIVAACPRASSKVTSLALIAGSRQTIPADGHCLLSAIRNMGVGGSTPGAAVMLEPRGILDAQYLTWHSDAAAASVVAYCFDMSDQAAFYVYPQSLGTTKLEINYSVLPPEIAALTDPLTVKEIYQTALYDYVMYRAHQKDSDYAGGQVVAGGYLSSFTAFMTSVHQDQYSVNSQQGKT